MAHKKIANAVARFDNLEFLSDVVPRTITYKEFKQRQTKQGSGQSLANGQTTLDGKKVQSEEGDDEEADEGATESDYEMVDAPEAEEKSKDGVKEIAFREYHGPSS